MDREYANRIFRRILDGVATKQEVNELLQECKDDHNFLAQLATNQNRSINETMSVIQTEIARIEGACVPPSR